MTRPAIFVAFFLHLQREPVSSKQNNAEASSKSERMKRPFILILALLSACLSRAPGESSTAGQSPKQGLVGTLKGKDLDGKECSIDVLSYLERRDADVQTPAEQDDYTNLEKSIHLRLSFQSDPVPIFIVKSQYSAMWDAYETNYLSGSLGLGAKRSEIVKIYLNSQNQIAAVDYQRDPTYSIMGVGLGGMLDSCYFLQ